MWFSELDLDRLRVKGQRMLLTDGVGAGVLHDLGFKPSGVLANGQVGFALPCMDADAVVALFQSENIAPVVVR